MAMDMYFCTLTDKHEYLLAGITKVAEAALWFTRYGGGPLAEDMILLRQVLDGLRPVVFSNKMYQVPMCTQPIEIRDKERVFGRIPHLAQNVVTQITIQYPDSDDKAYLDVAWWASDGPPDEWTYISDIFSFIPDTKEAVKSWSNIIYGISWLKTCRFWNYKNPTPLDLSNVQPAVFLSYINLTQKIGGIPGFVCDSRDTEAQTVFLLLGSEAFLSRAAMRLSEYYDSISDEEFNRWFNRGIYLPSYHFPNVESK